MPGLLISVPRYCRHKASSQAVVNLDGRDFYLGVHGSTASIREYDRLVALWQANGRCLPHTATAVQLTVNELLVRYLEHAGTYYRKNDRPTSEVDAVKAAVRPLVRLGRRRLGLRQPLQGRLGLDQ